MRGWWRTVPSVLRCERGSRRGWLEAEYPLHLAFQARVRVRGLARAENIKNAMRRDRPLLAALRKSHRRDDEVWKPPCRVKTCKTFSKSYIVLKHTGFGEWVNHTHTPYPYYPSCPPQVVVCVLQMAVSMLWGIGGGGSCDQECCLLLMSLLIAEQLHN